MTAENVASFVNAKLSRARFAEYLADPDRSILAGRHDGRIVGYAMLIRDGDGEREGESAELSKLYVLPEWHGTGVAATLMEAVLVRAAAWGARSVWLGVNQENQRAQRFYVKSGFVVSGTRTFRLGTHVENDYVMTRAVAR